MALSEFYKSTIIEANASFGYSNFSCDPDEITRVLGITPDEIMRKGEEWTTSTGKIRTRPFNSWHIASKSTSKDVNVHIRNLLKRLGKKHELVKKKWGKGSFGITWKNNYLYAGTGPFFEVDVLQGIARWHAELYQDIYQIDQDEVNDQGEEGLRRMSRDELIALAKELRQKNPQTKPPTSSTTDPSLQRFTETDNAVIEELMAVILQHGLTADQAKLLLGRTIQLLELGKQAAHEMPDSTRSDISFN